MTVVPSHPSPHSPSLPLPTSPAILVLEDGRAFRGRSVGAPGERACELVFHTGMTGYQEILTDPSYRGQGVVMTYPQIGNYGTTEEDAESDRCWAEMMIMRECSPVASSWRSQQTLPEYFQSHNILAMEGVDTRELTLALREHGALRAVLSTERDDVAALTAVAASHPPTQGRNLVAEVTCKAAYSWQEPLKGKSAPPPSAATIPLVCLDFGVKKNILRSLAAFGFAVQVLPAHSTTKEIMAHNPAAVFLSNGPGDPASLPEIHAVVREIANTRIPIFGICLGHQILAHVFGAQTTKMKFGHHGANHPVIELDSGRIDITSQNHSYAVDPTSLAGTGLELTHRNGNDDSIEGMRHTELPIFSVQYHPEAAPGPHESQHLFAQFLDLVNAGVKSA